MVKQAQMKLCLTARETTIYIMAVQLQLQSSFLLLQIIIIQFVFKRLRSQTLSCFLKCFSKSISQNLGSVSTNSWIKTKSFGHLQFNQLLMAQSCFF